MKVAQYRCYVVVLPDASHNTSCRVLDGLELLHFFSVATIMHSATLLYQIRMDVNLVILTYWYCTVSKRLSPFRRNYSSSDSPVIPVFTYISYEKRRGSLSGMMNTVGV